MNRGARMLLQLFAPGLIVAVSGPIAGTVLLQMGDAPAAAGFAPIAHALRLGGADAGLAMATYSLWRMWRWERGLEPQCPVAACCRGRRPAVVAAATEPAIAWAVAGLNRTRNRTTDTAPRTRSLFKEPDPMLATAAAIRCIVAAPPAAARAAPVPRGAWEDAAQERAETGHRVGSPTGGEGDGPGEPH